MKTLTKPVTVGVLALQGGFKEHIASLHRIKTSGAEALDIVEVRLPAQLASINGLIIPGGESTVISRLLDEWQLSAVIRKRALAGELAIWGTCAGAILLSKQTPALDIKSLDLMDIIIKRNAFGRQVDSFVKSITAKPFDTPFSAVFIRAPLIETVGKGVDILVTLDDGRIVAARQQAFLATAFHPELTADDRWHRYFIDKIVRNCISSNPALS